MPTQMQRVFGLGVVVAAGIVGYAVLHRRLRAVIPPKKSAPGTHSNDVFRLLTSVRCFSRLPLSSIMSLLEVMVEESFPSGTEMIHIGDVGNECYLLLEGAVEVRDKNHEYVVTIPQGSFFGEMALLNNTLRVANVVAATDVRVLTLGSTGLYALLNGHPVMREAMQKEVIRRNIESRFSSTQKATSVVQGQIAALVDEEFEKTVTSTASLGQNSVKWRKGNKLGSGGFGVVYSAINLDTGMTMAVKVSSVEHMRAALSNNKVMSPQAEAERLQALTHPNLLKVFGFEVDMATGESFMFMEIMAGSLKGRVKEFGPLPEALVRDYTRQILLGLQYLHQQGILHRDIKPDNILISASSNVVKLADFGLSRDCLQFQTQGICGTPAYMSPESITGRYGVPSDVWALGCSLIELLTGIPPWAEVDADSSTQLMYAIATTKVGPSIPCAGLTDACQDFLKGMFLIDPRARLDCAALLAHEWIRETSSANNSVMFARADTTNSFIRDTTEVPALEDGEGTMESTSVSQGGTIVIT